MTAGEIEGKPKRKTYLVVDVSIRCVLQQPCMVRADAAERKTLDLSCALAFDSIRVVRHAFGTLIF